MVILSQTQTTREDQSSYGNSNIYLKNVKGAPSSNEPLCDRGSFKEFEVLEKVMCLPETKIPRFPLFSDYLYSVDLSNMVSKRPETNSEYKTNEQKLQKKIWKEKIIKKKL